MTNTRSMWEMRNQNNNSTTKVMTLNKRYVSLRPVKNLSSQSTSSKKQAGFTLIEVIIVIAILAILSAIVSPMYSSYIQRSKISEALATLGNLSTKMEKNYLDFRKYTNNETCAVNSPSTDNFNYACISSGQNYTWTATSSDGNYKYSVNNNFDKITLAFDGQSMSSVNCWMISDTGTCF